MESLCHNYSYIHENHNSKEIACIGPIRFQRIGPIRFQGIGLIRSLLIIAPAFGFQIQRSGYDQNPSSDLDIHSNAIEFGEALCIIKIKRFQVSVFRIVCPIPLTFVDCALPYRRSRPLLRGALRPVPCAPFI